jgi:alginate O-acetyltransferase complex protein AlgJ
VSVADQEPYREWLPESRHDKKYLRGKDGWLFLDGDRNEVVRQHTGEVRFTQAQLEEWQWVLETRNAWLTQRGIPYVFLIPPNPHSVHSDKLPDSIVVKEERPLLQLLRHLDEQGSFARLLYPVQEMQERRDEHVYTRTSSHWTYLGGFLAYGLVADQLEGKVPMRRLEAHDVLFAESMRTGDLGAKVTPPEQSIHVFARPREASARVTYDNGVSLHGRRIEYTCEAAPEAKCLVFGDSFAYMVLPFLVESFRTLVLAHVTSLDYRLVLREQPDVVVQILNERFLIVVSDDARGRTLEEWEEVKRAKGAVSELSSQAGAGG